MASIFNRFEAKCIIEGDTPPINSERLLAQFPTLPDSAKSILADILEINNRTVAAVRQAHPPLDERNIAQAIFENNGQVQLVEVFEATDGRSAIILSTEIERELEAGNPVSALLKSMLRAMHYTIGITDSQVLTVANYPDGGELEISRDSTYSSRLGVPARLSISTKKPLAESTDPIEHSMISVDGSPGKYNPSSIDQTFFTHQVPKLLSAPIELKVRTLKGSNPELLLRQFKHDLLTASMRFRS